MNTRLSWIHAGGFTSHRVLQTTYASFDAPHGPNPNLRCRDEEVWQRVDEDDIALQQTIQSRT